MYRMCQCIGHQGVSVLYRKSHGHENENERLTFSIDTDIHEDQYY